ncbi:amidohydrolase [Maribellus comscasis]|uniref:Amidohydrolase n=2 Tax=Maribellus comscasis TaxID=2681766 RepID=A0A6I6K6T5_9BACT|nr:amidohydrolase [Maribellus comscasis]
MIFNKTAGWIRVVILLTAMLPVASLAQNGGNLYKVNAEIEKKVIDWRRDFHEHPELSNREFRTSKKVAGHLRSLGMEVTEGIAITGVKGVLKGGHPGPVVALRADMDALPIVEKTDVPFTSKVDVIFGQHMASMLEAGKIACKSGPIMAGASDFKIIVQGKGSHGSAPWSSVDPIAISAQIVNSIQTIVSRNINIVENPAVVTVGAIQGGNRSNIIPESVEMEGTIRVFSDEDQKFIYKRLTAIAENIAEAEGGKAIVKVPYTMEYPVTINDEALSSQMLPTLEQSAGKNNVVEIKPITGAEDFSMFAQKVPGLCYYIGGMPKGQKPSTAAPHHTAEFFLDESSFVTGVNTMTNLVLDYLDMYPEMAGTSGEE